MTKIEILEMIVNGESSGVEFKEEGVSPIDLAEEIVAFSNFKGGTILIGVSDEGSIPGVKRKDLEEEWVMNICRDIVKPAIIPYYEQKKVDEGQIVAVVKIDQGVSKPYYVEREGRKKYLIRVGSTKREATREELGRLFQEAGIVHYDSTPIFGSSIEDLDWLLLKEYFLTIRGINIEEMRGRINQLLINTELMVRREEKVFPTAAGMLLFGKNPQKFLPQSGITAVKFKGKDVDYGMEDRKEVEGTLPEQVEEAISFVERNTKVSTTLKGIKREDKPEYPVPAIREAIVNAVVHRNYSMAGSKIRLLIFEDRLEIRSPGKLPNTVSLDGIKVGCSSFRNPVLVGFMQHYGYVEKIGLGIPIKIIKGMIEHNGKQPKFEEVDEEFRVTLYA